MAVRASFTELHHRVEKLVDPAQFAGPRETLRLVVNPHTRIGGRHETYDFVLEGDLLSMEAMAKSILQAAKEFRKDLKAQA